MFCRNLFVAVLAVAAVGVKGSPFEWGDEIGIATVYIGKDYQGDSLSYLPGHAECNTLRDEFDNSIHSFEIDIGMICQLYE